MEIAPASTKLTINLRDGIVDVQGSEEFVRSVYQDFKGRVSISPNLHPQLPKEVLLQEAEVELNMTGDVKTKAKRFALSKTRSTRAAPYKPTFKTNVDLAGLEAYFQRYAPKNHSEKILIFAMFLRESCNIAPCSADDVYTCYFTLKHLTEIPEAFPQAFHTAQARTHFIEFGSMDQIKITIAGENYFTQSIGKRD